MKRRLVQWGKTAIAAALMAGLPIMVSDYVLSRNGLAEGRVEAREMAERVLERAEAVIGEGLTLLAEARKRAVVDCGYDSRAAYGHLAFQASYVQQIGLIDEAGTLICGEPMGALAFPARLPAADPGDPSVMIGILKGNGDSQAVVTLRVDPRQRLVARFDRDVLDVAAGPSYFRDASRIEVFLEDGSVWLRTAGNWAPEKEPGAIVETATSHRYPIKVVASASAVAAEDTMAPLRAIVLVVATLSGIAVFAVNLWNNWRGQAGDAFTRAVENQEFVPYYQPVFDLFTGEIRGCEVLVRWRRENGTMVPPGQFLPYAEATGLIRDITRQLMAKTVEDCAAIYRRNPHLKLSINLTAMHFNDLEILDEIQDIYGDSGIAFDQLCFEVTEQHPLKDLNLSRAIIGRIQALGAAVALDDVGTGHGGLAYLQKLGVDIIKIDKMFIDHIGTDHSSQTIVDTLVELANQLGLGIIAEGVETQDQLEHLKRVGVATAQGYVFSPPVPAKAYLEMLEKGAPAARADTAAPTAAAPAPDRRDAA
ncbi:cyclic di-GMP phosphodiesterase YahA [Pleomorphomonas sp. SM30]|uniref:cyclic-guanylate-specific phosphodiesterase n=1 Tax=Oharaeibacter diazotrophicus TaxID=1920512 RepID=A0A4R6RL68_9HYPH|nr:EAL domain-containing protein (putative c-di-GMP-specific phosphodiesterase class I) [Oharaeibacter diazotrophicus]BBE70656.1 cyclic di-GMP phosphodiesterase YahA [Pleomorphomonas sp. SM30]